MRPTLRPGATGTDVRDLQRALSERLALDPPLDVDGHYGPTTRLAVLAFQSSSVGTDGRPLIADGVVGPQTWWALTTQDASAAFGPAPRSELRLGPARGPLGRYALAVAASEREAGAGEVGADNRGPWVEKYSRGKGGPWCAWFVSWCVEAAAKAVGSPMPFRYSGGSRNIRDQLHAKGLALPADEMPMPGDLVVWWREAPASYKGHIGLVTDTHPDAGMFWTIEGNRGAFPAPVRQFSYVLEREKRLLGFARLE